MALDMQDVSPAKDKGVLKKILTHGTGAIVPQGALVRGNLIFSKLIVDYFSSKFCVKL